MICDASERGASSGARRSSSSTFVASAFGSALSASSVLSAEPSDCGASFSLSFRNCSEPDLAMVPRFSIISSSVMPMPVSATDRILFSLSSVMRISNGRSASRRLSPLLCMKRTFSSASEALDKSSRRKISRLVYRECVRIFKTFRVSARNSLVWASAMTSLLGREITAGRGGEFRRVPSMS